MTAIEDLAKRGLPLDGIKIIDSHCHMGYWHNFKVPCGTADGMLVSMDTLGIDVAFVSAHSAIGPDHTHGNDLVLAALDKYPQRFFGYATINPAYTSDIKSELNRCLAVPGMRGVKLHPSSHGLPIDHQFNHLVYEIADQRALPVLIHVWGKDDVKTIGKLAGQYRNISFLMGHCGADVRAMEHAIDVVGQHAKVYGDLALSLGREGNIEWLAREMGAKKILFATDMPFLDPRPTFGRLALADISDKEKTDIFGGNIARLLEIDYQ